MKICWHKWEKYGKPYRAHVLGGSIFDMHMVQTRFCEKCGGLSYRTTVLPVPEPDSLQVKI